MDKNKTNLIIRISLVLMFFHFLNFLIKKNSNSGILLNILIFLLMIVLINFVLDQSIFEKINTISSYNKMHFESKILNNPKNDKIKQIENYIHSQNKEIQNLKRKIIRLKKEKKHLPHYNDLDINTIQKEIKQKKNKFSKLDINNRETKINKIEMNIISKIEDIENKIK